MPALLVYAVERSRIQVNAPTSQRIAAALASIGVNGGHPGRFLGSAPRVTRVPEIGDAFITHAAWPYAWTTSASEDVVRRVLIDQVRLALDELGGNWTVTAPTFNPTTNGTVQWWESGEASITRTRDEWVTWDQRADARENPTGPTTDATHPTPVGGNTGRALDSLGELLTPLAWLGGAALGGYLLWRTMGDD